jgi:hypothetical protein
MRQCRNRKRHRGLVLVNLHGSPALLLFRRRRFTVANPARSHEGVDTVRAQLLRHRAISSIIDSLKASSSPCMLKQYLRYIAVARQLVFAF